MFAMVKTAKTSLSLWGPIFLVAALFAVPLSSSAKSICIGAAVAFIALLPEYRRDLVNTLFEPWCQAALLLFFIALIGCIYSPASFSEKTLVLEKYSKLLYLPILAVGFRERKTRETAIYAFLLAMLVTCLFSFGYSFHLLTYHGEGGQIFRNHIMTGHMMGMAAYLAALLCYREQGRLRILFALLFILYSYQIVFVSPGRTECVVFAMLMFLLMVQLLPWRKAIAAVALGCILIAVVYNQSALLQDRVARTVHDWQQYQVNDKDTSIGYRLQFHAFAKQLFERSPWVGKGTASFTYAFRTEVPVPSWDRTLLEPHSQYWLVASEFGVVGILALLFFLGSLFFASFQLHTMGYATVALLLPFVLGNMSDSLLFYSGSGYFFLLFMALCLGERVGPGSFSGVLRKP